MHEKERHRIILSAVQEKPVVTVTELVDLTDSSEATIRRDVAALALQNRVKKVRGGAEASIRSLCAAARGSRFLRAFVGRSTAASSSTTSTANALSGEM